MTEEKTKVKKESFMQGVMTIMFSQILIKVLGLIYTLYFVPLILVIFSMLINIFVASK